MEKERADLATKIYNTIQPSEKKDLIAYSSEKTDSGYETTSLFFYNLKKDSHTREELEVAGFHVIYPRTMSNEELEKLSIAEQDYYDLTKNDAMIIDKQEKLLSLDLANDIYEHFFSNRRINLSLIGFDKNENSLSFYDSLIGNETDENSKVEVIKLLKEVGYKAEIEDESRCS